MSVGLQGKIAIVTGSARGIGKSIAEKLAGAGATLVVSDILREEGEAVAATIGKNALFLPCDVGDRGQVVSLVETVVKRFGRLDVMVNNAGINTGMGRERVNIDEFLYETWDRIMQVDLNGAFYCCREAAAQMVKQQAGSIVNIASVAGVVALRLQIAFVAAKAALIKMTEAMACELGPRGVRVNAVSPGSVDVTPGAPIDPADYNERFRSIVSFIPQGRLGLPGDIADAVRFLASDEARYINGHNLVVDGGWTCGFNRDW
jgi:3-oxoacyl-[acyl-carrier protein] reductase